MWPFALPTACRRRCTFTITGIVVLAALPAPGFPLAICSPMAKVTAVKALHDLELRGKSLGPVVDVIDIASHLDASVCGQ